MPSVADWTSNPISPLVELDHLWVVNLFAMDPGEEILECFDLVKLLKSLDVLVEHHCVILICK